MIVWLVGLPSSGKTTIGERVAKLTGSAFLDGDVVRETSLSNDLGFSREDRTRHLLRVGAVAKMLDQFAPHVICAFICPYEEVRKQLPIDLLVYVKCPIEVCMARDVRGLYARAKTGQIRGFTGYDAPFEEPTTPDLILPTDKRSIEECVTCLLEAISSHPECRQSNTNCYQSR